VQREQESAVAHKLPASSGCMVGIGVAGMAGHVVIGGGTVTQGAAETIVAGTGGGSPVTTAAAGAGAGMTAAVTAGVATFWITVVAG
jgi:hypothetical protein